MFSHWLSAQQFLARDKMESRSERRVVIKFLVAEGEKASKVLERLQAVVVYGEHCLSKSQVYEWYQRFRDGRTSISDDEHPGRLCVSDDETVAVDGGTSCAKRSAYYN